MRYYLVTTAISEIWNHDEDLLLLGPWCLLGKNNGLIKDAYTLVPTPWKPAVKIKEAADYCYQVYSDLLPEISEELNRLHKVSYPLRYWQVLIGPWLLQFIKAFYDRYKRIENALSLYPDLFTHAMPLDSVNLVSIDTEDFIKKVNQDYYNLFLFSVIIRALMIPQQILETQICIPKPEPFGRKYTYNWKTRIFNKATKRLFSKGEIMLVDMYHLRNKDRLLLKLKSGHNKIGFMDFFEDNNFSGHSSPDNTLRHTIRLKGSDNKFRMLLCQHIPMSIPVCYIEDFRKYSEYINSINNIGQIKVLGSVVGWWLNEIFKFLAARLVLNNIKLIEFQHGGGYRMYLAMLSEKIAVEKNVFYVWGRNSSINGVVRYLPSPHLCRLRDTYAQKNNRILFVGTSCLKYLYRFSTSLQPEDMPKYFEDKRLFLKNLNENVKSKLLYRPYYEYGWGELEVIKQECPNIGYLLKGRLVDYMKKVKLVVIDHPQTSFLEALAINVPCIFYWDHDVYLMRDEAEVYFELLRKAGILFKDPESAAQKVNEIADNPMGWWQGSVAQDAISNFCERYAHTDHDWLKVWGEELKRLAS